MFDAASGPRSSAHKAGGEWSPERTGLSRKPAESAKTPFLENQWSAPLDGQRFPIEGLARLSNDREQDSEKGSRESAGVSDRNLPHATTTRPSPLAHKRPIRADSNAPNPEGGFANHT